MAIPDLVAGILASLVFLVAIYTLYFRVVDDWLQKKEVKLGDVRNSKTSALLNALDNVCKINQEFNKTDEDERFTVVEFKTLIESAREVDMAVDEFTEWNSYLSDISIKVRSATMPWILFILFINLSNLVISWEEYSGLRIILFDFDIVLPLFGIFLFLSLVFAAYALLPMRYVTSRLNELDRASQGFQTIRTWEHRA